MKKDETNAYLDSFLIHITHKFSIEIKTTELEEDAHSLVYWFISVHTPAHQSFAHLSFSPSYAEIHRTSEIIKKSLLSVQDSVTVHYEEHKPLHKALYLDLGRRDYKMITDMKR